MQPAKFRSVHVGKKNVKMIIQFQSFPSQLLNITFAEVSKILCRNHLPLPWQPQQINIRYSHHKNFNMKQVKQLLYAFKS